MRGGLWRCFLESLPRLGLVVLLVGVGCLRRIDKSSGVTGFSYCLDDFFVGYFLQRQHGFFEGFLLFFLFDSLYFSFYCVSDEFAYVDSVFLQYFFMFFRDFSCYRLGVTHMVLPILYYMVWVLTFRR